MLLLANGLAGAGSGLLIALGAISAVFPAILIAAAVLMLIKIKRQEEEPAAETASAEVAVAQEESAVTDNVVLAAPAEPFLAGGKRRYNKSFMAKLIQSDDAVKEWYSLLKNAFLSYEKTSSRVSWQADSINMGRVKLGKFAIRGKTLCLFLALDPDDYAGTKYKVERAAGKRYESVPCMYKIKGKRRAKYAAELIAAVAEKFSLVPAQRGEVDYRLPYEDTESLIGRGLIRNV